MKLQDMVTVTNPLSREPTTSCNCSHWARTHFSRYSDPVSVTVEYRREGGLSTLHFAHGKLSAKYKPVVTVKEERCKTFQALLFRQHGSLCPLADIRLGSNELPLAETGLREGLVLAACRMDHGLGLFVKLSIAMGPVELWKPAEVKSSS